jgi:hypothetical protein
MSAAALAAVERELERWEWQNRLDQRPKTYLGEEATTLLVEYTGIIYLRGSSDFEVDSSNFTVCL